MTRLVKTQKSKNYPPLNGSLDVVFLLARVKHVSVYVLDKVFEIRRCLDGKKETVRLRVLLRLNEIAFPVFA